MDCCIEKGELERALEISEKLAQREVKCSSAAVCSYVSCLVIQFSCGVAAAFECKEYIKRENVCITIMCTSNTWKTLSYTLGRSKGKEKTTKSSLEVGNWPVI